MLFSIPFCQDFCLSDRRFYRRNLHTDHRLGQLLGLLRGEIQILDDGDQRYQGKIRPEQYHGSVYDVIPARTGFLKKPGEWQEEEIEANGRRINQLLDAMGPALLQEYRARHPAKTGPAARLGRKNNQPKS